MENTCIETLRELINEEVFEQKSKKRKQDFTRNYILTFSTIILIMLRMVKGSTQNELNRAMKAMGQNIEEVVTQQTFSAARQKIKWEAFLELFQASATGSYNEEIKLWRAYRVFALDGSILTHGSV